MTDHEEIPQGWQRINDLLYTAELDAYYKGKPMWRNRLMVRVSAHHGSAAEQEVSELATRLHAFLSTPATAPLLGQADTEPAARAASPILIDKDAAAALLLVNDAERHYLKEIHETLPVSMSDFLHVVLGRAEKLASAPALPAITNEMVSAALQSKAAGEGQQHAKAAANQQGPSS